MKGRATETECGSERDTVFHSLAHFPDGHNRPGASLYLPLGGRGPRSWAILHCYPRHITRQLEKHNSQNPKQRPYGIVQAKTQPVETQADAKRRHLGNYAVQSGDYTSNYIKN